MSQDARLPAFLAGVRFCHSARSYCPGFQTQRTRGRCTSPSLNSRLCVQVSALALLCFSVLSSRSLFSRDPAHTLTVSGMISRTCVRGSRTPRVAWPSQGDSEMPLCNVLAGNRRLGQSPDAHRSGFWRDTAVRVQRPRDTSHSSVCFRFFPLIPLL